ncbi:MAG: chorismate mutase [Micavibrio aeruginosavorus]|uniref:chorismate mutase n=1 Tax=Micavibrio aeruginosavorus TaxID=349221 RepID=A0A2W5PSC8_9BACT|nr:MAG: chorismate mutase [Micavibrio aeruginosavorus]
MAEPLKPLRAKIDALDDQIIDLLAERMDVVREVGATKARENITLIQSDRVNEVRERCAERGAKKGVNPELIRKIYTAIIDEAHQMEQLIISSKS